MSKIGLEHPVRVLGQEIIDAIRNYAGEAEKLKRLHPSQLRHIRENQWMKMLIPEKYGGLGLSLPHALQVEEALSYADGSTGWVVTLCSGAGWFVGFVNDDIAKEFFVADDVCIAGSGSISGIAEETGNGYVINGRWKYASGALHATAFTANCVIARGGVTMVNDDGSDRVATFIFKHEEVTVYDTWRGMGMVATGSHSFEVTNLHVTRDRCFRIDPSCAAVNHPTYHFPFLQLAETTLTVNMSGMALRFLDLAESMTRGRQPDEQKIGYAKEKLNESRSAFGTAVEGLWRHLTSESFPGEATAEVSNASKRLVQTTRQIVDELFPVCGLAAADRDSEINRVWRNFQTAGLHALFRDLTLS